MDSEEGSFAITQGSTSIFNASTRGRNAWIGRGDGHKVHYGESCAAVLSLFHTPTFAVYLITTCFVLVGYSL